MILALDIGNSNIVIGGIDDEKIHFISRLRTDHDMLEDEYAISIRSVLQLHGVTASDFDGAIISSVVPPLSGILKNAVKKLIGVTPLVVGPGIKTGLYIPTNNPGQLGSDIVVNNVAALTRYKSPVIVVDLGTATTISATDEKGTFIGCAIMPGVTTSLSALVKKTALLQEISYDEPANVIGTNTVDCMKSGIIYGTASMIDGMLIRFKNELGYEAKIVATGGHAKYIVPHCRTEIELNPNLLLEGLLIIYKKNI